MGLLRTRQTVQGNVKATLGEFTDRTITILFVFFALFALYLAFFSHNRLLRILVLVYWIVP